MALYRAAYIKTFFDNMVLPYIVPDGMDAVEGKWYVINTKFGEDIGLATSATRELTRDKFSIKKAPEHAHEGDIEGIEVDDKTLLERKTEHVNNEADNLPIENLRILKTATEEEVKQWKIVRDEEQKAYEQARQEIIELNLEMKLINVHFLYQRKKVIFNFTADNRVDFRQLVKRLAGIFKTRIEMRQIGVRDAAKVLGGYGVCGVINCCLRSNCHMNSIYLKMAKDQGFVVNSSKLTGSCGRLMCCLAYEMDFYTEARKKFPEPGSLVQDGDRSFMVSSFNVITGDVYISDEAHHQKKIPLDAFRFIKKDLSGRVCYRVQQALPAQENQPQANND